MATVAFTFWGARDVTLKHNLKFHFLGKSKVICWPMVSRWGPQGEAATPAPLAFLSQSTSRHHDLRLPLLGQTLRRSLSHRTGGRLLNQGWLAGQGLHSEALTCKEDIGSFPSKGLCS